jgi:hypothetical protein
MSRVLALATVLLLAPAAAAQIPAPWDRPAGFGAGFGRFPPIGPGVRPPHGGPWVRPVPPIALFPPVVPVVPVWSPYYGGFFGGTAGPTIVIANYSPQAPAEPVVPADPLDPAHYSSALGRRRAAATAAAATITTGVTVTLPAAGEVWLNGVKQPGTGPTFDLTVTTARPGESVPFALTARWQGGGQTYEYERTLALSAGDKQSLTVVRGTPVK